jgi:trans-aconitate methyltransferase
VTGADGRGAREQRFVFDEVAEQYARARPGYPAELIEDLIREAGLARGARVLELGAGPGTASVAFAGRGYMLCGLEPGPQLAELARRRLASDPDARIEVATFEQWPLDAEPFDLVFAAQAFHWIDPSVRFTKAAAALRPEGTLAIFANRPLRSAAPVDLAIQRAYAIHAPELQSRAVETNTRESFLGMFEREPAFTQVQCREYPWREQYSAAAYLALLQTHSDHRLLPPERSDALLRAIGGAIEAHGGHLTIDYVCVLCWARRALQRAD